MRTPETMTLDAALVLDSYRTALVCQDFAPWLRLPREARRQCFDDAFPDGWNGIDRAVYAWLDVGRITEN